MMQTRCDSRGFRLLGLAAEKPGHCGIGVQIGKRSGVERNRMLFFEQGCGHRSFWLKQSSLSCLWACAQARGRRSNLDAWNLEMYLNDL